MTALKIVKKLKTSLMLFLLISKPHSMSEADVEALGRITEGSILAR
jgi:hypothetical protein